MADEQVKEKKESQKEAAAKENPKPDAEETSVESSKEQKAEKSSEGKRGFAQRIRSFASGKRLIFIAIISANVLILSVAGILSLYSPSDEEGVKEEESHQAETGKGGRETPQAARPESEPCSPDLLECAQLAYQREEWQSVLALYEKAFQAGLLEETQEKLSAFIKMGEAFLKIGDQSRAFEYFKKAAKEMDRTVRYGSLLEGADRYFQVGDFRAARRMYYSFLCRSSEVEPERKGQLVQAYLNVAACYWKEYEKGLSQKELDNDIPWEIP